MSGRGAKPGQLNEHGKQEIGKVWWEPSEYRLQLLKINPKYLNEGWDVVLSKSEARDGHCVLLCKGCEKEYSISNPHQTIRVHKCQAQQERECVRKGKAAVDDALLDSPAKSTRSQTTSNSGIVRFMCHPTQREKAIKHFALHMYITTTPFQRADEEHLKLAFSSLGCELPGEKVFRTRLLDEIYAEVRAGLLAKLRAILKVIGVSCTV
jgi:hypothetical protein